MFEQLFLQSSKKVEKTDRTQSYRQFEIDQIQLFLNLIQMVLAKKTINLEKVFNFAISVISNMKFNYVSHWGGISRSLETFSKKIYVPKCVRNQFFLRF